jgi:plastocyanin
MKTSLHRTAFLALIIATSLAFCPTVAFGTTFNVTVGPNGDLVFSPSSVTIHPGDQVRWTFGSGGHSTTSGSPGQPNGIWDSGIRAQGTTFTRTFNSAGTFPYYCTPHGGCCGMVGTVTVVNASPTPTPPPMPGPPIVTTNAATNVARNSATLNGLLYPHGLSTSVNFQYGPTTSYGSTTPMQTRTGNAYQNISANVGGLMANRVYHFRIKATNMAGTRFGGDRTFTTQ